MTHEELDRHEAGARDLIEALRKAAGDTPASPGFVARVMARADQLPVPLSGGVARVGRVPIWPTTLEARIVMAIVLTVALFGAVPQYITWINAYVMGVPSRTIHQARIQEHLWQKNFACATQLDRGSSNYAAITGEQVVVVAWACPSGDVLVTIESSTDDVSRRSVWIPLKAHHQTAGWLDGAVDQALAAAGRHYVSKRVAPMITVLCQKWLPKRFIKRRIQLADGRCFDEIINPRTGRVMKRQKAPCDRGC